MELKKYYVYKGVAKFKATIMAKDIQTAMKIAKTEKNKWKKFNTAKFQAVDASLIDYLPF